MKRNSRLCCGDRIEVRSKEEILKTLDKNGQLDGLPFMPEMFKYCGGRFRVYKRAHKTCDPPNGIQARRMSAAVHLEGLRCDGQAHGGCQAGCLIFWKGAWLKEAGTDETVADAPKTAHQEASPLPSESDQCTEGDVIAATRAGASLPHSGEPAYACQSTDLHRATRPLKWWDPWQYVEDYTSGNVRLSQMLASWLFFLYSNLAEAGLGIGSAMRWTYDAFQKVRGGTLYPARMGKIHKGARTPSAITNLTSGELVRVKSYREILETLDQNGHNRGMYFDVEMVPFCGKTFRVLKRVQQIIDERTGTLLRFETDAIILESVTCQARYSHCRKFCPRSIFPYWREIWLERLNEKGSVAEVPGSQISF
jgi:hypothetical protein